MRIEFGALTPSLTEQLAGGGGVGEGVRRYMGVWRSPKNAST